MKNGFNPDPNKPVEAIGFTNRKSTYESVSYAASMYISTYV